MKSSSQSSGQYLEALPMWKIIWFQFLEHRMAVASLVVIGILSFLAVFAPLLSQLTGLDPQEQNVFARYLPVGSTIDFPAIKREQVLDQFLKNHDYPELKQEIIGRQLVATSEFPEDLFYDLLNQYPPTELSKIFTTFPALAGRDEFIQMVSSLHRFHLLGTDELGRDVLMRLIYGIRVSVGVGILVALSSALLGLAIGSIAGFYGGRIDAILMRFTDALLSLPLLVVLIVVSAIDLTKLVSDTPLSFIIGSSNESIIKMVVILCLFCWMQVARLVRGSILTMKEQDFVLAAKTLGATNTQIIFRHLLPNVLAPLLVAISLGVGNSILFEAALSFLGLGIMPPTPSWGNMLNNAQEMIQHAPLLAIMPGLLILTTVVSFNYLGDGLRDAIDPKTIRR